MSEKEPYGQDVYGTQPPAGGPPLATVGQRFLARLIDTGLLIVLAVVVSTAIHGPNFKASIGKQMLADILIYGLYFVYEGLMLSRTGQTLGKMALKIRVANFSDGSVPGSAGWLRAAVFALPGILSAVCVGALFWLLNVLWCTWDQPYRQCLHDKAAKTVVVQAG
jgi:uncharacterized RDD family membrane protein YckC